MVNNQRFKLAIGNFEYLGAAAGGDPQGSAYQAESCAVKYVTINNNNNSMKINY